MLYSAIKYLSSLKFLELYFIKFLQTKFFKSERESYFLLRIAYSPLILLSINLESKLYFNPKTNETSIFKKEGFVNGCGCILKAKCRVPEAKCIINK